MNNIVYTSSVSNNNVIVNSSNIKDAKYQGGAISEIKSEDYSSSTLSTSVLNSKSSEQIKFNLHIIEFCNYSCKHCFAKFGCKKMLKFEDWCKIVDNCHKEYPNCYFNIAGGEPLIASYFTELVEYCRSLGHKVSVISNGILMTENWIFKNAPHLDTIGISIDSFDESTMIKQGRCTRSGKILSLDILSKRLELIKAVNPDCLIKINTVVSSLNKDEIMRDVIKNLPVSRWKILKMQPFNNGKFNNLDIIISDHEYHHFVSTNLKFSKSNINPNSFAIKLNENCSAIIESNLKGGYLMIDANGFLVDDTLNDHYVKVSNCLKENIRIALTRLSFNEELYHSRYAA